MASKCVDFRLNCDIALSRTKEPKIVERREKKDWRFESFFFLGIFDPTKLVQTRTNKT